MKKRALLFMVVIAVLLFTASFGVCADIVDRGSCGNQVTWSLDDEGTLIIKGKGDMTNWLAPYSKPWNDYSSFVKTLEIMPGVTSVGDNAFAYCGNLTDVSIPDSVTYVGHNAFTACAMETILIPGSVKTIGREAFYECPNLTTAVLEDGVTSIGYRAFLRSGLVEITLPETLTYIGQSAFDGCKNLESITIPKGVTAIGDAMFAACTSLKVVVIPNGVKTIGRSAFHGCTNLLLVAVPEGVTSIGKDAFKGCDNVIVVAGYDSEADYYTYENNIDFYPFFDDVANTDAFYFLPVYWAALSGITAGTSEDSFSPNGTCTRSQVVTFLWRAAGEPAPQTAANPFKDVNPKDFYYKAVLWAVENGITAGTSANTFSPKANCTRSQVVTFLHRAEGEPEAESGENPFSDVAEDDFYYDAVLWAVESGITTGTSATTFSPVGKCTRGQVVTFLYRDLEG